MLVRKGTEGILAGSPFVDEVFCTCPPEKHYRSGLLGWWEDLKILRRLRSEKFDYVFELSDSDRGVVFAVLSGAAQKITGGNGRNRPKLFTGSLFDRIVVSDWKNLHRVEKDHATVAPILDLPAEIPPLTFENYDAAITPLPFPAGKYIFLHPATRWQRKKWPMDKWKTLLKTLATNTDYGFIISSGPDYEERKMAGELAEMLGSRAFFTGGGLSWARVALLMRGAVLFVGVDTAAMHLAAACGVPIAALFGPSKVSAWRPWQVRHVVVRPPGLEDCHLGKADVMRLMEQIEVEDVYQSIMLLTRSP